MPEAIIFDLDETLMYEERSVDAAFRAVCGMAHAKYGVDVDALHASVLSRAREMWYTAPVRPYTLSVGVSSWEGLSGPFSYEQPNERALIEWVPGYRRQSWRNGLADHGVEDEELAVQMAEAFTVEREKHHVLFDETMAVLESLRGRYRFGMLTNGAPSVQRAKVAATRLGSYFDAIVVTGELGVGKPDQSVFEHILGVLRVEAAQAVMVGDSLKNDIGGAQQMGITAVWINRDGRVAEDGIFPDHEIKNLRELPLVLERL